MSMPAIPSTTSLVLSHAVHRYALADGSTAPVGFQQRPGLSPFTATHTRDATLYSGLVELYQLLVDEQAEHLQKQSAIVSFFTEVQQRLNPATTVGARGQSQAGTGSRIHSRTLHRSPEAGRYLPGGRAVAVVPDPRVQAVLRHDAPCVPGQSADPVCSYAMRSGQLIADVALAAGFADQAHFQRTFKQHFAATPGQYRG